MTTLGWQKKAKNLIRMTEKRHLGDILATDHGVELAGADIPVSAIKTYWAEGREDEPINSSISTLFSQTGPSAKNGCLYCVVTHGALLRIYAKQPLVADQVAVNHLKADITPRQKAMLDFAVKVCANSRDVNEGDYAVLHRHGVDEEDIWDITANIAFFGMSNRMPMRYRCDPTMNSS